MPTPVWPVYADSRATAFAVFLAGLRRLWSGRITPIA